MLRLGRVCLTHVAREQALTAYAKHLIREWEMSGKTLVDLERASGARSSGHFSQIKSGKLGASQRVAEYLARAHGITVLQLRTDAERWYEQHGKTVETLDHEDPGVAKAIEASRKVAETFGRPMPEHTIRRAISRWKDQIGQQSSEWWFQKFAEEERIEVTEHHAAVAHERKEKRHRAKKRRAIRELAEEQRSPKPKPAPARRPKAG